MRQHGRPDNTLIVYVTDNGWINLPDQSAYAPRSKRSQYEGGIRTPIMFCWPGHVEPGRDDEHPVSSIDLVPTTLSLLGQAPVAELPGIDVLDTQRLFERKAIFGEILEHDIVDMEKPEASLMFRWIIRGHKKLIVPAKAGEPLEYFDLAADPREQHNLIATAGQSEIAELTAMLDQWWPVSSK